MNAAESPVCMYERFDLNDMQNMYLSLAEYIPLIKRGILKTGCLHVYISARTQDLVDTVKQAVESWVEEVVLGPAGTKDCLAENKKAKFELFTAHLYEERTGLFDEILINLDS